ncbi:septal ring lytic transglycosylase RlpA family protein [Porphyromonas pogonae]|uniref:septal ring lytic transglycosylase RlpA family protein n=1 Tax=Porphyromonas pogonae TaxID=867595 RepID=UPI002E79EFD0|nr:septal ring lytic transglycosylase RlpA family protein [Porphyromonas pogonae]
MRIGLRKLVLQGVLLSAMYTFCHQSAEAQTQGKASFYGAKAHGRLTASGARFHKDSLTCAHRSFPFGTLLNVKNLSNGKVVTVKVTDRGPRHKRLIIDLSYGAAKAIGMLRAGICKVEVTKLQKDSTRLPIDFKNPFAITAK